MHDTLFNIERSILSSFIFSYNTFVNCSLFLKKETFSHPPHQGVFLAMLKLEDKGFPIDEEFIKKEILDKDFLATPNYIPPKKEEIEGTLIEILSANPITNVKHYCLELQKEHIKRETHLLTLKLQNNDISIVQFKNALEKIENLYKKEESESQTFSIDYSRIPQFLGDVIKDLMAVNNYPPSMVLSTVLTSMAGLIGARAKITNGYNLTVFPVIWSMIVAPSSISAKSTLFRFTKKCIFDDMQKDLFTKYESDLIQYKEDLKRYNALAKEDKMREIEPERPQPKLLIFANDGTPEAKITALHRNQNGGVVYFDEMKAELERSNNDPRYKALKTSIFDGETYHKELVKDGGTYILKNPVLSEIGLITEQWLMEAVQKNDIASGFMARYLFSYNQRKDFKPLQITKNILECDKYSRVGRFIIEMLEIDRSEPLLIVLSFEAKKYYVEWFNDFSRTAFAVETDEEITTSYRLSTYVLKFALILHIFNNASKRVDIIKEDRLSVSLECMKGAIYLMELFQNENYKILNLFEKNKKLNFKIDDIAIKLKKKINASEGKIISKSKATNGIRGLTPSKLENLIEQGLFTLVKVDRTTFIKEA
jgi:replicative DNA helicase